MSVLYDILRLSRNTKKYHVEIVKSLNKQISEYYRTVHRTFTCAQATIVMNLIEER